MAVNKSIINLAAIKEPDGCAMDIAKFERYMIAARYCHRGYRIGYQRGLKRRFFGKDFGAEGDHELWMALGSANDPDYDDPSYIEMGRGYRDGFAGIAPVAAEETADA